MRKLSVRLGSVLAFMVFLGALGGTLPARAAETTIGCTVPELFNAVTTANSGDIINLASGCVYTLTQGYDPINNPTTALYITIPLTINGNGATIQRASTVGTPSFRLLYLEPTADLTLNGLTLSGGAIDNGAAAVNDGGKLTISNSTISDNTVSGYGGAINTYNGGTLTVTNSTFSDNTADANGGAIYNSGGGSTVTLTNVTFTSNSAASGGAVSNDYQNGVLNVTDCTFSSNHASNGGGGIYNGTGGGLTITNSSFTSNSADSQGGAVLQNSGTTGSITSSSFTNNSAYYGGAIGMAGGGTSLNVTGTTFTRTNASLSASYGGGIWNYAGSTVNVAGSTFSNLSVDQIGGGINNDGYGGNPTFATVTDSIFDGNLAGNGGAIFNDNGATFSLSNSTLTGNTVTGFGGGIGNGLSSPLTITYSTISDNSAVNGGGIYTQGGAQIGGSIIAGNNAATPDVDPAFTSLGYNLIGDTTGLTISGDTTGNLTDAAAQPLNLDTVADNGGTTRTMALLPGSVAIDAGNPAFASPPDNDQRGSGYPRVVAGRIDIGAFEAAASAITVQLPGRPTPPAASWVIQIHVVVRPQGGGAPVYDQQVTTDTSGQVSVSGVLPGNYVLWVKAANLLAVAQNVTVAAGANSFNVGLLPAGDTDGNNVVNLTDFSLLAGTFGKQSGNPGYDGRADFNGDTVVNLTDFSLLASNFGQSGAP